MISINKNYLLNKLLLVFLFSNLLISCYDLESTIKESRIKPSLYGNDLLWQGYKVGRIQRFNSEMDNYYAQLLIKNSLWVETTVTIPGYFRTYYDSKGRLKRQWVPGYTVSTYINNGMAAYNLDNIFILAIFAMEVPYKANHSHYTTTHWFKYYPEKEKITALSGESYILNSIKPDMDKFPPKDPFIQNTETAPSLTDEEFGRRKAFTLKNESEEFSRIVNMSTGIEMHLFNQLPGENIYNKHTSLDISVKPIYMYYIEFDIAWRFFFIKGNFTSDMGLRRGAAKSGDQAIEDFKINKTFSYLMYIAASLFGAELKFTAEKYDLGTAKYYTSSNLADPSRDIQGGKGYFSLNKKQLDLIYHPLWRDIPRLGGTSRKTKLLDFYFGYRYLDYSFPRIAYSTVEIEENSDDDSTRTVSIGESKPQFVKLTGHMIGLGVNNYLKTVDPGFNFLFGAELYVGYGWMKLNLNDYWHSAENFNAGYDPQSDRHKRMSTFFFVPGATIGVLYNITTGVFKSNVKLDYSASLYANTNDSYHGYSVRFDKQIDIFHCFTISFNAQF